VALVIQRSRVDEELAADLRAGGVEDLRLDAEAARVAALGCN